MNTETNYSKRERKPGAKLLQGCTRYFLPVVVLAIGGIIAWSVYFSAPKAKRVTPPRRETYVSTVQLSQTVERVVLNLMGTVIPSRQIDLQPRVSGEIVGINPKLVPGGRFNKGEILLQLDDRDYKLEITKREGELAKAEQDYQIERGEQAMGKYYWNLVDKSKTNSELQQLLTLRKPQLNKTEAACEASKAALEDAKLDLERTSISAPFNAVVMEENVDLGAQVSLNSQLAVLAGIDEYWVKVAVPVDRLQWLYRPVDKTVSGSMARITYPNNAAGTSSWPAVVARLLGQLEQNGRMARLLLSVDDPLGLKEENRYRPPLLINSYVSVAIEGTELKDIFSIPRSALRDNNTVWIAATNNTLEIRTADIIWRDRERVFITEGLAAGERLIVSDLSTPVAGMPLKEEQK
jgi:RND family efflux transporter MFP subunit